MKLIKKLSLLMTFALIAASMMLAGNETLLASNLVLTGDTSGISITPANENLFLLNNMLLGETAVSGIEVKNSDNYPFTLSVAVKAIKHSGPTGADLLDILDITVSIDGVEITNFPAKGGSYSLGTFAPGKNTQLDIYLALSGDNAGNEYQNTSAELQWTFEAVSDYETPVSPTRRPSDNRPSPEVRVATPQEMSRPADEPQPILNEPVEEYVIDDIPVPLAILEPDFEDEPDDPALTDIPEEPVPLAEMPKTGEAALYVSILCGVGAIALGFVTLFANGKGSKSEK